MRKLILLSALLLLVFAGCSGNKEDAEVSIETAEQNEQDTTKEQAPEEIVEEVEEEILLIDGYKKIDTNNVTSYSSGISNLFVKGNLTEVKTVEGNNPFESTIVLVVQDKDNQYWNVFAGTQPNISLQKLESLVSNDVTVFGVFEEEGYEAEESPIGIQFEKIIVGAGTELHIEQLQATTSERNAWLEENGKNISRKKATDGTHRNEIIYMDGTFDITSRGDDDDEPLEFNFYSNQKNKIDKMELTVDKDVMDEDFAYSTLKNGCIGRIYFLVDESDELNVVHITDTLLDEDSLVENATKGSYSKLVKDKNIGKYIILEGIINNVSIDSDDDTAEATFYQIEDNNLDQIRIELEGNVGKLKDGNGIRYYCKVTGKSDIEFVKFEKIDSTFTVKDYWNTYKKSAKSYPYKDIARDVYSYRGKLVVFSGQVLQNASGGTLITSNGNIIFINNYSNKKLLEGDYVKVYGTVDGEETYTTVLGTSKTVPRLRIEYLDITG